MMKKYYLLATTALVASFCACRAMADTSNVEIPVRATVNFPCKIEWDNSSVDFGAVNITELGSDGWVEIYLEESHGNVSFRKGSGSSTGSQLAHFSVSGGCNNARVSLSTYADSVGYGGGSFRPYIFGTAVDDTVLEGTGNSTGMSSSGSANEFYVGGVLSIPSEGESYINYNSQFTLSFDY